MIAWAFALGVNMANEANLKGHGFHERTASEQREIARKGGVASGEARRERKLIKDRILERMGEDDWDTMIDNLISRAQDNVKDFEVLRDTIGEKPKEEVKLDTPTKFVITRTHKDAD